MPRVVRRWAWWPRCQGDKTLGASSGLAQGSDTTLCGHGMSLCISAIRQGRMSSCLLCRVPAHTLAVRMQHGWFGALGRRAEGTAAARLRHAQDALLCAGMPLTDVDGRCRQRCDPSAR